MLSKLLTMGKILSQDLYWTRLYVERSMFRRPEWPPGDEVRPADQPNHPPASQPLRLRPRAEPDQTEVPAADGGMFGS